MLIHLIPKFFNEYSNVSITSCEIEIPELFLTIHKTALMIKAPFPNKKIEVACRKKGRKAINGLLIETDKFINQFTVKIKWGISIKDVPHNEHEMLVDHIIHYHVNDNEFDFVSDDIMLWGSSGIEFKDRCNKEQQKWHKSASQPQMRLSSIDYSKETEKDRISCCISQLFNHNNIAIQQEEFYYIPTLEQQRINSNLNYFRDRFPNIEDAFAGEARHSHETLKPTNFKYVSVTSLKRWIDCIESDLNYCEKNDEMELKHLEILKEINNYELAFFANTNDLIVKAQKYSKYYKSLSNEDKSNMDKMLAQPIMIYELPLIPDNS